MAEGAISLVDFRVKFPEFANVPDALVNAQLSDTILEINASVWRELTSQGHGLLTAHRLSLSPWGQGVKLSAKDTVRGNAYTTTTYGAQYMEMRTVAACGCARLL